MPAQAARLSARKPMRLQFTRAFGGGDIAIKSRPEVIVVIFVIRTAIRFEPVSVQGFLDISHRA